MTERKRKGKKEKGEKKRHFAHESKIYNLKLSCRTLHSDYWGDISFYKILFPSFVVCVHACTCVCVTSLFLSLLLSVPAMSFSCNLSLCILLSCFPGATDVHSLLAEIVLMWSPHFQRMRYFVGIAKISNFSCFYSRLSANVFLWLCDFWSPPIPDMHKDIIHSRDKISGLFFLTQPCRMSGPIRYEVWCPIIIIPCFLGRGAISFSAGPYR